MFPAAIRRRVPIFGLLVALLLATSAAVAQDIPTASPESVGMSSEKLEEVDRVIEGLVDDNRLAGAVVMIARRGHVVHLEAFGKRDLENDKPMQTDTIVRIYSMSKAVTTAAALILYDRGKFDLEDPVEDYIPELKGMQVYGEDASFAPKRPMTIRDLMRHTSGLTYGSCGIPAIDEPFVEPRVMDFTNDLTMMTRRLGKIPLLFEPGADWHYGVSIDVLGRLIEVVSGQRFDAFLQQELFGPLDMKDTGFFVPPEQLDRLSAIYVSDGKGKLTLDETHRGQDLTVPRKLLGGGGSLGSTARDYLRFLTMIANGGELYGTRILKQSTVDLMTHNQIPAEVGWVKFGDEVREGVGFGLGFSVRVEDSDWGPVSRIGEYGWSGAAGTHCWVSPRDELIVITLEQTKPYSFMTEFAVKKLIYDAIEE